MAIIVGRLPRKVRANIRKTLGMKNEPKYGNEKVHLDGYTFDSLKEKDRYLVLLMKQKLREISGLKVHPKFKLLEKMNGQRSISYEADFSYYVDNGFKLEVEDVKSRPTRTPVYRIKKKLMKKIYGIAIKEV